MFWFNRWELEPVTQQAGQKITYTAKREVSCPPERKEPALCVAARWVLEQWRMHAGSKHKLRLNRFTYELIYGAERKTAGQNWKEKKLKC